MIEQIKQLRSGPYGNQALGDRHVDWLVAQVERLTALAGCEQVYIPIGKSVWDAKMKKVERPRIDTSNISADDVKQAFVEGGK